MLIWTITIDDTVLQRKMKAWPGILDPQPMLEMAAEEVQDYIWTKFQRDGPNWRRLKPGTYRARDRRWGYYKRPGHGGAARPILRWRGALMDSMTKRGVPTGVWRDGPGWIEFGSALTVGKRWSLAAIHHKGLGTQPRRALYWPGKVGSIFLAIAENWRDEAIKRWEVA